MIDNISQGRLVVGFISAGAQNLWAYGMQPDEERDRYHEAYDLMIRAWTDEKPFAWRGEHYQYECVSILPRPLQVPHPPIWTVAASAQSLEWAARNRIGIIASGNTRDALRLIEHYRRYAETECDWSPGPESVGIAREICIASTETEARQLTERVLNGDRSDIVENIAASPQLVETGKALSANKRYIHRPSGAPTGGSGSIMRGGRSEEGIAGGQFLTGTPVAITEQVLEQQAACNAGVLVLRAEMSDLGLDLVGDEFELIAKEMLPELHRV
jgi:alkanesulfonate monooxygenase SsuD/methylene tetrahydromethanopterin reductase-like flavin-dependent oxidoreductase (luciferase family)